jgi:predicted MFS family arabinose efflux permease
VPIGILALAVTATVLHLPRRSVKHRIDWMGATLLAGGTSSLILLLTLGGTEVAWDSPLIVLLGIAGVVLLGTFFFVQRRAAEPILPLNLFRNRVFNVAGGTGFILGFAMFGAITFLPVFLQLVDGASATSSGLNLLPLMGGLLTASIISGQLISRFGRYKVFPVIGTALSALSVFALSTIDPQTSRALISVYMVFLGAGLGLVMQVLIIAVQNAVAHRDLGVATSSATFLRSMGSSFGVSIFGTIFSNQLAGNLARNLPAAALQHGINPTSLQGNPAALAHLPPAIHAGLINSVSQSLHVVFLSAVPVLAVAFLLTLFLHEVPLRTREQPGIAVAEEFDLKVEPATAVETLVPIDA